MTRNNRLSRRPRLGLLVTCALLLTAAIAAVAGAQRHNTVSFEEGEEGWYPLFDGRTLDGWSIVGNPADWRVLDGEIVVESGGMSLLMTDETFSDFELKVDFLAAPGTNSGIFLRITGRDVAAGVKGYEVNIAPPSNPFPTGSVMHLDPAPAGSPPSFGATRKAEGAGESEEWRTFDVVANGGRITVAIDGQQVAELVDPDVVAEGYLALQHNQGRVAFRNVKLRRLKL
jgi:hypothetical protein